jgi:hypothetical protein
MKRKIAMILTVGLGLIQLVGAEVLIEKEDGSFIHSYPSEDDRSDRGRDSWNMYDEDVFKEDDLGADWPGKKEDPFYDWLTR